MENNEKQTGMGVDTDNSKEPSVINVDEIKKETSETVQQVKDTIKTVNLKEDAEQAKGFLKEMWKNPIKAISNVAKNPAPYFKMAILLMTVWMLAAAITTLNISSLLSFRYLFENLVREFISAVKSGISPLLGIVILSTIVFVKDKSKKHSLTGIMSVLVIAKIPSVLAQVISVLRIFGSSVVRLTSPIGSACHVLSVVLTYFALKTLFANDDDDNFIRQFVVIYAIYCIAAVVTGLFGLYI